MKQLPDSCWTVRDSVIGGLLDLLEHMQGLTLSHLRLREELVSLEVFVTCLLGQIMTVSSRKVRRIFLVFVLLEQGLAFSAIMLFL